MARTPRTKSQDSISLPSKLLVGTQTSTPSSSLREGSTVSNKYGTSLFNTINEVRLLGTPAEMLRVLANENGDISTAVATAVRMASTALTFKAYTSDGQLSDEGTFLAQSIATRMDITSDYSKGYDDRLPLKIAVDALLREVILSGATSAELVLDEARLPYKLQPISVRSLKFVTTKQKDGNSLKIVPQQTIKGAQTTLDYATVFYVPLDPDPETSYATSPIKPAIKTTFFQVETLEDIRRVVNRSGHSRLLIELDAEKVAQMTPAEFRSDPVKQRQWMDGVLADIQRKIEELNPESALVFFNTVKADYLNSEIGATADYSPLIETLDGLQSTALKTPPSILGKRMGGSQNTSSTETLIFIKTASGIQPPVAALLSRLFTLAARLYGFDGYVTAEFAPINLRPEDELEAYKTMQQNRILELLSLGFYTDQEAAEKLGTGPRAPGAPPLSGTMFHSKSVTNVTTPNADPARQGLVPKTPAAAGGADNKGRKG